MFGGRGVPTFDGDFAAGAAAFGVPLCCCSVSAGGAGAAEPRALGTSLFCGCSAATGSVTGSATGSATAGASAGG